MSVELQKQIKDNSTDMSSYFKDLYNWTEDQEKQEGRRNLKSIGGSPAARAPITPTPAQVLRAEEDAIAKEKAIKRDKTQMSQYYADWDRIDVDGIVDDMDDKEFERQRRAREARTVEKDRILDELALQPDGDRKRTSTAKPRVKISVRQGGRRASPYDLALPRKEEANRYYAEGRYKEAVGTYSTAIDGLEKYEPPDKQSHDNNNNNDDDDHDGSGAADCFGLEPEALSLKCTLLANRAQALLKLEEWREAVEDCSEALRFDSQHEKALLRRGFALARMKRWSAASRDLERAVVSNPSDKKAAAELQMVRRMLEEQAKADRVHAKATMRDPTRAPTMPTRRLAVRVQRGDKFEEQDISNRPEPPKPRGRVGVAVDGETEDSAGKEATGELVAAVAAEAVPKAQRQPYVPRSVRMRGRQAAPGAPVATSSAPSGSAPSQAMNFYTFESQWTRLRARPHERAAFLRRLGADALPTLFRDSLDSELVASIVEALAADLSAAAADCGDTGNADVSVGFVAAVLGALPRTPRFDLSLRGLVADERRQCQDVIAQVAAASQGSNGCSEAELDVLRLVYQPSPPPKKVEDDSDEPPENGLDERSEPAIASAELKQASLGFVAGPAAEPFSLDGCD